MTKTDPNASIAAESEVLALMTQIMRGDIPDEKPKLAERAKAAELLGKHYGAFDGKRPARAASKSRVVTQINAAIKELMTRDKP